MTMWTPDVGRFGKLPRFEAIAEALAADIAAGKLKPGDRLPTHRELAERLGVSLGTVTRAYLLAEQRGLTSGEVGRGTFVRGGIATDSRGLVELEAPNGVVEMSVLVPPVAACELLGAGLKAAVGSITGRPDLMSVLSYHRQGGSEAHRAAGAAWLSRAGLSVDADDVLVCASGQHAAMVAISTLTRAGDTIMTEALTSPLLKDLASWAELKLHGLPIDEEGILPDAFEAACRAGTAKVLYCMPTVHNPTASIQSEQRRRELAEIAMRYDVAIVEDGVMALLAPDAPPPLTSYAPDHACYLTSLSKTIAPGLRVGYLRVPARWREECRFAIRASTWVASPLAAEIAAIWIADGTADRIAASHREEAAARQQLAAEILGGWEFDTQPTAYHLWLQIPEPWRSSDFINACRERGVSVTSPEAFVPGRGSAPHAARVCIGQPSKRACLVKGLEAIAEVLAMTALPAHSIV